MPSAQPALPAPRALRGSKPHLQSQRRAGAGRRTRGHTDRGGMDWGTEAQEGLVHWPQSGLVGGRRGFHAAAGIPSAAPRVWLTALILHTNAEQCHKSSTVSNSKRTRRTSDACGAGAGVSAFCGVAETKADCSTIQALQENNMPWVDHGIEVDCSLVASAYQTSRG